MNIPEVKKSHKITYLHAAIIAVVLGITGLIGGFAVGWLFGPVPDDHVIVVKVIEKAVEDGKGEPEYYTCSMHPTVQKQNPKDKCPICHMDLIAVYDDGTERTMIMTEESIKLAEIQTMSAQKFFPTYEVRLFGTIDYDEKRITTITAYFPGRLERLYVDYTGVQVNEEIGRAHV